MFAESDMHRENCNNCIFVKNDPIKHTLFCGNIHCKYNGIPVYSWDVCSFHECRKHNSGSPAKAVDKIDPITNKVLGSYRSISEAARRNYITAQNIRCNLNGKIRTCGGFIYRLHMFDEENHD